MYEVMIRTEFASAHNLRNYEGSCETLHGHNWKADIVVQAEELDEIGLALDFNLLKARAAEIINDLDHIYLNEHEAFREDNPSSENIARYIFKEIGKTLDKGVKIKKVTVWETDDAAASYFED